MYVRSDREIIISRFQDPGALCAVSLYSSLVIAGEQCRIHIDRDGLALSGLQDLCLSETDELDG